MPNYDLFEIYPIQYYHSVRTQEEINAENERRAAASRVEAVAELWKYIDENLFELRHEQKDALLGFGINVQTTEAAKAALKTIIIEHIKIAEDILDESDKALNEIQFRTEEERIQLQQNRQLRKAVLEVKQDRLDAVDKLRHDDHATFLATSIFTLRELDETKKIIENKNPAMTRKGAISLICGILGGMVGFACLPLALCAGPFAPLVLAGTVSLGAYLGAKLGDAIYHQTESKADKLEQVRESFRPPSSFFRASNPVIDLELQLLSSISSAESALSSC